LSSKYGLLTRADFWGGLSIIGSLVSLALPWWGIEVNSYSGGIFPGSPLTQAVVFDFRRLDQLLATNYVPMTTLVLLTSTLTGVGSAIKHRLFLSLALLSSVVTVLIFFVGVGYALDGECRGFGPGAVCISGLVGSATLGSVVPLTWGFKAGFYVFVASAIPTLVALNLRWGKAR
jgi:hypothetical protein